MSSARRLLGLLLALMLCGALAQAQTARSTEDPRNQAPTVNGGTGLFTVYDAQTLRRGEFNLGFFANHFHRDPGDLAFQVYTLNFQVGFGDRFEAFASWEIQRRISAGTPSLLSGFYFPDVRTQTLLPGRVFIVPGTNLISSTSPTFSDPCRNGGFPGPCTTPAFGAFGPFTARPSGNDTAIYPGLGAPVGGILPALPPGVLPNYQPDAPFLSRFFGSGQGDIWVGGKIRFTGPKNPFGLALIPLLKIPTTSDLSTDLQRGRGTGAWDYGVILAMDGRLHKHINLSANSGYIRKGDPKAEDMNLGGSGAFGTPIGVIGGFGSSERALDLPDEWRSGLAVDFPLSQYLQFIAELRSTYYVGSRTPSLLRNHPVDVIAGARIFPARWVSITAAWQRHLNWQENLAERHGQDGFIVGLSIGHTNAREEPIVPNQPPTVTLEVGAVTAVATNVERTSPATVCVGDTVALRASASDPDGDTLLYSWTTTGGRIVGDGPTVSFDSAGLAPGDYTVTVQVDDGCGCVAFDSKTVRVATCPPSIRCFNPNIDVTPASSTVEAGQAVDFSTPGVTGGQNYGNVTYSWTASAGTITGSGTSARLDTTGVPGGTSIDVRVAASSDQGNCSASGSARVTIAAPRPPEIPQCTELTACNTFKRNNARVDNACKNVLQEAARRMQSDPQATLIVEGYRADGERPAISGQRAKNVRDRLADGSVGVTVDANRITVRDGGQSSDGNQVRLWICPSGATPPAGGATLNVGDVTPEARAAAPRRRGATRRHRRKP